MGKTKALLGSTPLSITTQPTQLEIHVELSTEVLSGRLQKIYIHIHLLS